MDYNESVIINDIIKNKDGTLSLYRSDIDEEFIWKNDDKRFDGDNFNKKWNEKIEIKNLDSSIKKADLCLYMYRPEGWIIKRAKEIKGKLIDGGDYKFYQIGDKKFQDSLRFSIDNIII